ncbi:sugar phosphate isomerase/epimerase family protein [Mesorhizobium sp. M00.F.Ca.ET.216.01.1.1]|uniref:sugar phosphate isomerase/epimerase family protein n=1 Tax=Mesorhizobium sp. M00.F.Ca.ET.216.01.1.1 TaxID=2500528 RepID=UPI000FD7CE23|nr:sugar phosphate isomerase/epimerase family protein [Mesorhizobium sp. M00.F.Ca.ET.216.01.1.1]TGQ37362.1 sugar phosphate isomerase/epimerase [Mesorhizobium sp. M00.F.Ca.ET.216.01.1.1]
MNTFGLHTFAIAPVWDLARIEPQMDRLKELGIGLMEIPLLRPEEIDIKRTRGFAIHYGVELIPSLGLPRALDVVERPDEALDFLQPAFKVCNEVGSEALGGVTYGTIGKTTGRAPTKQEIDGMCRFLERAAKAAKSRGLKLGIEPCNRYETHLINRGIDAAKIIERVGADNIFIHLDTYHMHIEEESFASGFEAAAPYLGYVHVSEANRGVPGRGMLNWRACMKAIADIGYRGAITLESMNHVDVDIAGGLAVWRPVAEDPRDVIEVGLPFLREEARKAGLTLGQTPRRRAAPSISRAF